MIDTSVSADVTIRKNLRLDQFNEKAQIVAEECSDFLVGSGVWDQIMHQSLAFYNNTM